jgi:hypothetical protein
MSYDVEACVLCGSETTDRAMRLVEWTEPVGGEAYAHIPTCADRAACRYRVEIVLGEPWPVDDRTPAPVKPTPDPEPPAPVIEATTQPEEEVIPWLQ